MKMYSLLIISMIFIRAIAYADENVSQSPAQSASQAISSDETSQLEDLEKRVTDMEVKSLGSRINFSGDLFNFADYYWHSNSNPPKNPVTHLGESPFSTQKSIFRFSLGLNFSADITSKLKVYGRFVGRQIYQGHLSESLGGTFEDSHDSSSMMYTQYDTSSVIVEKAYFDYALTDNFTVSAGRLPTGNGPPSHIKDGLPRQATYPVLALSMPLDGVALTSNILNGENSLSFRFIYSPFLNISYTQPYKSKNGTKSSYILVQMIEYANAAPPCSDHFSAMIHNSYMMVNGYDMPADRLGYKDPNTGLPQIKPSVEDRLAVINQTTFYTEWNKLAKSNFDYFLSYQIGLIIPKGILHVSPLNDLNTKIPVGTLWSEGDKNTWGHTILTGTRYTLPIKAATQLGAEYIWGSKNAIATGFTDDQQIGFYRVVRGNGYHLYANQNLLDSSTNFRFGYYFLHKTHSDMIHGKGQPIDEKIKNLYVAFKIRF